MTCAICDAALKGIPLTEDAINLYNAGKLGMRPVTMVNLNEEITTKGGKFTFRSLGGFVSQALGLAKPEPKPLESKKKAQQKARGRLLENVDLNSEPIGSMEQIDHSLQAAKEKG